MLLMLWCAWGTGVAQAEPKRLALVMGNDAYQSIPRLDRAGNDAVAMARELKEAGFDVLLQRDSDSRSMDRAVRTFLKRINGGDHVVVFYAGHGVQLKTGNYLLPVDIEGSSEDEIEKFAYSLDELSSKLSLARASFSLIVIDACRDNPFAAKGTRGIGATRGLAAVDAPEGQMIVYSAGKGQQALDSLSAKDKDINGVFTREFVKRMRQPGVPVMEVVRQVQDAVQALAKTIGHEQRPALYNEARGNFYFFAPVVVQMPPAPAAAGQSDEEIEKDLWASIKDETDPASFEAYLQQYPKGRYVGPARIRLAKVMADLRRQQSVPAATTATGPAGDSDSALWSAVSATNRADEYEVYLQKYPKGKFAPLARQRLQKLKDEAQRQADATEQAAWVKADGAGSVERYGDYLVAYPNGRYAAQARGQILKIREESQRLADAAWQAVDRSNSIEAYTAYLKTYPNSRYASLVAERIVQAQAEAQRKADEAEALAWQRAEQGGVAETYAAYLQAHPEGRNAGRAKAQIAAFTAERERRAAELALQEEARVWQLAEQGGKAEVGTYLQRYGKGRFVEAAKNRLLVLQKIEEQTRPGQVFKDCEACPVMVYLPAGQGLPAFAIGQTEVTQAQWQFIMGTTPSYFHACGMDCPVERVSWDDVHLFIQKLNTLTGKVYRLPTEPEWEYACLAGKNTKYCGSDDPDAIAWRGGSANAGFSPGNSGSRTHPVKGLRPNAFGVYDMSGNVSEWTVGCWKGDCEQKVIRGGSFGANPLQLLAFVKEWGLASYKFWSLGFRLVQ